MLELYKNIKKQRQQLNLTQTELAQKLGYADKSMIAKIEKGQVDLPQSKIIAFADALETTPGLLMGWSESNAQNDITDNADNLYKIDKIKLPLLGTVACGEPIYADEDRESYIMVGTDMQLLKGGKMTDIKKLKEKIEDSGMTMTAIARKSYISRETLYNRLNGVGEFTASEIVGLTYALKLTKHERDIIFLNKKLN